MYPLPENLSKIRSAVALTAAFALAGCTVGPDYVRPSSTLPEAPQAAAKAETPVNPTWWTLFDDADLDALVEQTLIANQDLQAAVARLEAAEAAAREAGADYAPTVNLETNSSRNQTSGQTGLGKITGPLSYNDQRAALSLNYEIDLWGRIRRNNEAARADLLASRFGRDSLRLTLVGQVASEYLNLRSLDGQIDVTVQTLNSRQESLKIVQARIKAGTASELDLTQAESSLNLAQAQLGELHRLRALSESQIGLLSGRPGLKIASAGLDKLPLPPIPPAGLPSALLEARPDIRQAEERLIAANARIGVAKAAYYPTISLTGALGGESESLSNLLSSSANIWSAAIGLTMPIFDAGRTSARVDQATAAQKETLANYRKTVQTAFKEVNDAIVGLHHYADEEGAYSAQVGAAQRALDIAQIRYAAGYSGYMDLLDAQRTLNSAQLQYLTSRKSRLGAAVDLFKAIGGGWVAG